MVWPCLCALKIRAIRGKYSRISPFLNVKLLSVPQELADRDLAKETVLT